MRFSIKKMVYFGLTSALLMPFIASAQTFTTVTSWINAAAGIVRLLIPLLIGVAIVIFFWGLIKYIWGAASDDGKKTAIRLMVGGIIAIFIMTTLYGIVYLLGANIGVVGNGNFSPPTVNGL